MGDLLDLANGSLSLGREMKARFLEIWNLFGSVLA